MNADKYMHELYSVPGVVNPPVLHADVLFPSSSTGNADVLFPSSSTAFCAAFASAN